MILVHVSAVSPLLAHFLFYPLSQTSFGWIHLQHTLYFYTGNVSSLEFYIVFRLENKKNFPGDRCNGYFCLPHMYPPYDSDCFSFDK